MRLDQFLSKSLNISRSETHKIIKSKTVSVNGEVLLNKEFQLNSSDVVRLNDNVVTYEEMVYYLLNKPKDFVCDSAYGIYKSVFSLLEDKRRDLSCAGRLDVDTTGLVLITNDGNLIHQITSNSSISKEYYVKLSSDISDSDIKVLENGTKIYLDKEKIYYDTLPSKVERISSNEINISINEGKFHQIKKMMNYVNNNVVELRRFRIGSIYLDDSLLIGQFKKIDKPILIKK
jgi:16S rRNA pseudouridine516 synthase